MAVEVPGRVSQTPVGNVSQASEQRAGQDTTISQWTLLVPPNTTIASGSEVTDLATGRTWVVEGNPAGRPDHRPKFMAAALRLISDMQQEP